MAFGGQLAQRFNMVQPLGLGGFGELFGVRDRRSGDALAVRQTNFLALPSVLRALGEVVALHERLTHEGLTVARVTEVGQNGDLAWYGMHWLEGESLLARVRRCGPMSARDAGALIDAAAECLARLHDLGILHQDINPRNLFVTTDGQLRLLELGIAPALAAVLDKRAGAFATPGMRAAEQFVAEARPQTDLYALGASLYYAVTGKKALLDGAPNLRLATDGGLKPPALAAVPPALRDLISRSLALQPNQRYPSAREFRAALASAVSAS